MIASSPIIQETPQAQVLAAETRAFQDDVMRPSEREKLQMLNAGADRYIEKVKSMKSREQDGIVEESAAAEESVKHAPST